jgi:PKD repeat protein
MKKLLTLAIGFILANTALNAQNCDFIYQQNSSSGSYYFQAPILGDTNNTQYFWSFENGTAYGYGLYVIHNYSQSMIDVVTLNVYNNDSTLICSSTQTIQVEIDTIPGFTCPIYYTIDPSNPNTVTFSVPGANYPSNWAFGDSSNFENGFVVTHTFPGPGIYQVCSEINNSAFYCYNCVNVYVQGDTLIEPNNCNASFYASTSALVGYFIPTGYSSPSTSSYAWSFGDGGFSTEMYPYHQYAQSGNYNVCLTVANGFGCVDSVCQYVYIPATDPAPVDSCIAGFVISQENPFEVNIVNITTANNVNFTWTLFSSGTAFTQTGPYPSFQVDTVGYFGICVSIENSAGCSSTYCDSLFVDENGIVGGKIDAAGFTINVLSPQTITGFQTAGIKETTTSIISTYPNPFSDAINVSVEGTSVKRFEIYSADGKKIMQGAINGNVETVNTSALNKGIYLLNLIDINGARSVKKVVKN